MRTHALPFWLLARFAAAALAGSMAGKGDTAFGQCALPEREKVIAASASGLEEFGTAVALDGPWALVGAPRDADLGPASGSVHAFWFDGRRWLWQQELHASGGGPYEAFGTHIALEGDLAAVCAPQAVATTASGVVVLFERQGAQWNEVQTLAPFDGEDGDGFGFRLALRGDLLAVSSHLDDPACPTDPDCDSGSVYLYRRTLGTFQLEQKIVPFDGESGDFFGKDVGLGDGRLVVGSVRDDDRGVDAGAAYVYALSGGTWVLQQKLLAADAERGDEFGFAVAIDEDRIAVGAVLETEACGLPGCAGGATYLFEQVAGSWQQADKLLAAAPLSFQLFGYSLAFDAGDLLVGAVGGNGAAHLFRPGANGYEERARLVASDGQGTDLAGSSVALDGDFALIGAPWDDDLGSLTGSAYFHDRGELMLGIAPRNLLIGSQAALVTCGGTPGQVVFLFVDEIAGAPVFTRVPILGSFDLAGAWILTGHLQRSLGSVEVGLRSITLDTGGRLLSSATSRVRL